ncbi:MAG: tetratricopeptide repeat protein [Methylococcus sp.]
MQTSGILLLLIQIGFAVHALRRGYPLFWVFLIVFVPLIGCLLYIIMVLLPEFSESRTATQGARALSKALNPGKALREREEALAIADTVVNRIELAEEYVRHGRLLEAIQLYERSLNGIYQTDPVLLEGLAAALVEAGEFERARLTLDDYARAHPELDKPALRLLRARTSEGLGDSAAALEEYGKLLETTGGAEIKCRYGLLLKAVGRGEEATRLFEELLREDRRGNRHSRHLNREWVEKARQALAQ